MIEATIILTLIVIKYLGLAVLFYVGLFALLWVVSASGSKRDAAKIRRSFIQVIRDEASLIRSHFNR